MLLLLVLLDRRHEHKQAAVAAAAAAARHRPGCERTSHCRVVALSNSAHSHHHPCRLFQHGTDRCQETGEAATAVSTTTTLDWSRRSLVCKLFDLQWAKRVTDRAAVLAAALATSTSYSSSSSSSSRLDQVSSLFSNSSSSNTRHHRRRRRLCRFRTHCVPDTARVARFKYLLN
jgi:hypothetical protein